MCCCVDENPNQIMNHATTASQARYAGKKENRTIVVYLRGVPGVRLPSGGVVCLHRGGPLGVHLRRRRRRPRPGGRVAGRAARSLVARRRGGG